jgi:hypothetical protein
VAVPPECSDLNDEVGQLVEVISDWPIEDSGFPKPGLAVTLNQLAGKKAALDACIAQHPRGYQTQVVVRDFGKGGSTLSLPVRGVRWELAPGGGVQHILEAHSVEDQTISFWGTGSADPDGSIGVSFHALLSVTTDRSIGSSRQPDAADRQSAQIGSTDESTLRMRHAP